MRPTLELQERLLRALAPAKRSGPRCERSPRRPVGTREPAVRRPLEQTRAA